MAVRLERGSQYQGVWWEAAWPSVSLGFSRETSVSSKRKTVESILCTIHCARSWDTSVSREVLISACLLDGLSVLLRKIFLARGLAKARQTAGSWGIGIMSVFQDRFKYGEGAELIIKMHKARAKIIAWVSYHQITKEGPGSAPFWSEVTWVQTVSTCLGLQVGDPISQPEMLPPGWRYEVMRDRS